MPPKRIIKSNAAKPKPLPKPISQEGEESLQPTEAELRFDQEVLWCISQFEKLISSGKLPEAKRELISLFANFTILINFYFIVELESLKAVHTLKRPNVSKIQKISLMKQYFKDYKAKMAKEEELTKKSIVNVQIKNESTSKGLFVKRRVMKDDELDTKKSELQPAKFMFNFGEPAICCDEVQNVSDQVNTIKLSSE